ncbi:MAG: DUF3499 family protein, partial [Propionibacteriaceae bacterium]|nr:DUF3499 family protein [Propionibacteriaceae bacterium]
LHAQRTTAPQGWEIIRLPLTLEASHEAMPDDDLIALAAAVREVGLAEPDQPAAVSVRHLRLVPPIGG